MAGKVKIRNLVLGEGLPKICVPVMGKKKEDILASARLAVACQPDMIEWRADFMTNVTRREEVLEVLRELRALLKERALLFTFRTRQEGGEQALSPEDYVRLCLTAADSGLIDTLDVELFLAEGAGRRLIAHAQERGVRVILSNHDFQKTPAREELCRRLQRMQELGADVAKIAVMPVTRADVLTLLSATEEAERTLAVPVITMSMGAVGMVSRLLGEVFGCALTFGMAGQASAPGQIPVQDLRELLQKIHSYL